MQCEEEDDDEEKEEKGKGNDDELHFGDVAHSALSFPYDASEDTVDNEPFEELFFGSTHAEVETHRFPPTAEPDPLSHHDCDSHKDAPFPATAHVSINRSDENM